VRDKLTSPWSNPALISLTGGSWGLQVGAQSSDIILVFTTKTGIEGIAGGKLTLGADASVATGPVGRQARPRPTWVSMRKFIPMRGPGARLLASRWMEPHLDRPIGQRRAVRQERRDGQRDIRGPGTGRAGDGTAFPGEMAQATHTAVRGSPAPQADMPATSTAQTPNGAAPRAEAPRTYPLEPPK